MSDNPYAAPESDVEQHAGQVENGSIFWGSGRLSVASFFGQYGVLTIIFYVVLGVLAAATIGIGSAASEDYAAMLSSPIFLGVGALVIFVSSWVSFCQMIKRLHDRNMSGWWVLTVFIIIGVIFLLIPGKKVSNRFGAWRQTRTWEKVLAILMLLFLVVSIGLAIVGGIAAA